MEDVAKWSRGNGTTMNHGSTSPCIGAESCDTRGTIVEPEDDSSVVGNRPDFRLPIRYWEINSYLFRWDHEDGDLEPTLIRVEHLGEGGGRYRLIFGGFRSQILSTG